ncbi:hypothetical protein [Pseudooceanicola algae]|uniref:Uncharacterized protein n=1 Tax=Pseudooceanicola algae TaxID=1537215 RepID=A0A418SDB2_9RHOB|nr:hypothetical protein [Pseudooceanicola algae]QPM89359.1 hypothetical protein PSAL_005750 [Pseudooceanicola algae]
MHSPDSRPPILCPEIFAASPTAMLALWARAKADRGQPITLDRMQRLIRNQPSTGFGQARSLGQSLPDQPPAALQAERARIERLVADVCARRRAANSQGPTGGDAA